VSEELSTYASYSRGYKGGGFNLDRAGMVQGAANVTQLQFEEETVDSFEVGAKYRNANGRINMSGALFYADYNDFQLNAFNGTSFVVVNLPKARTYGVEVEGIWYPTDNLTFTGGLTYADTQYGKK